MFHHNSNSDNEGLSIQACAPSGQGGQQPSSGGGGGGSGGGGGGGGKPAGKKKRAVNEAHALVVTRYNYDPEMTDTYMKAVKAVGEQYAAENGVFGFDEVVEEKPENVGGKFAISYTILGVECRELKNVLMNAKQKANIEYATIKCGGQTLVL